MERAIGIISANYDSESMNGLTKTRMIASIPFGARYRMIDFSLSNMVNSGMKSIGVVISAKSRSLLDHIGFGKNWTLDRKVGGLYLLPETEPRRDLSFFNYVLQDLKENKEFLLRANETYAVLSGCHVVCNIDYQPILSMASEKNADVIMIGSKGSFSETVCKKISADKEMRVTDILDNESEGSTFLDTLIIRRELLLELIKEYSDKNILSIIKDKLETWEVLLYDHQGYVGVISCVNNYFKCSQELLSEEVQNELFRSSHSIITKLHDKNPTRLYKEANVKNSVLHSGCEIKGSVHNSIIFRDVKIDPGAVVESSILMPGAHVGANAKVSYTIIDKNASVDTGAQITGSKEHIQMIEYKE